MPGVHTESPGPPAVHSDAFSLSTTMPPEPVNTPGSTLASSRLPPGTGTPFVVTVLKLMSITSGRLILAVSPSSSEVSARENGATAPLRTSSSPLSVSVGTFLNTSVVAPSITILPALPTVTRDAFGNPAPFMIFRMPQTTEMSPVVLLSFPLNV